MKSYRNSAQSGFTLLELLVVICILICLMALLWPQLRPILEKKTQLQAMNECKAISDALTQYTVFRGGSASPNNPVDPADYPTPLAHADAESLLSPAFLLYVPELDPWGRPWEISVADATVPAGLAAPHFSVNGPRVFLVRSLGRNGADDVGGSGYDPGTFLLNQDPSSPTPPFGDDVVCADGSVIRWPGSWNFP